MALGAQIRKYRTLRGWRLEDLSDRSGIEVGTISALENRDSTRSKYALPIATALGLTLDQLLDETRSYWPPAAAPVADSGSAVMACEPVVLGYASNPTPPSAAWPFTRISQQRYQALMNALTAPKARAAADDIDRHLEILVERWEREAHSYSEKQAA